MFLALLYTLILILSIVLGVWSPKDGGSRPAWQHSVLLWILFAIIGFVLFEGHLRS